MILHYLQHVPYEGPGYIKEWAKNHGHLLTSTHLYKNEALPAPSPNTVCFTLARRYLFLAEKCTAPGKQQRLQKPGFYGR